MKAKWTIAEKSDAIGAFILFSVVFIIILPFILLYFLYKLILTPYDYARYKRSRYQRDFPHKYSWLATPHTDNEAYTAIKENDLPVEYIKWREEYDLNGYFVYKDILLVFDEPFFFDKKRGAWLLWPGNGCDGESEDTDETDEGDYENTDDCLTVDEAKKYILEEFRKNIPDRECARVVLFYSRKSVEHRYDDGGLEKMRELDDFVIYEKGALANAIKEVVGG